MVSNGPTSVSDTAYRTAVEYLFGRINYERLSAQTFSEADFKLQRMRRLLDLVGSPEMAVPVIHVAGTKGKGSTSVMAAAMLRAAGYRVGLYTSPHLNRFEERMLVNGEMASPTEVVELVDQVRVAEAEMGEEGQLLTFFELTTAMSWLHFRKSRVEIAVVEVGLGGRLDSTNLCHPVATVITSISRDHLRLLGETLPSIAREKAGIAKRGVRMLSGVTAPEPAQAIRESCQTSEAPLWEIGRDIRIDNVRVAQPAPESLPQYEFDLLTPDARMNSLRVPLAGLHQVPNTALAVAAVTSLRGQGFTVSEAAVRDGLSRARLPLRLEIVGRDPLVIVDAAHNDASMEALCATVRDVPARHKTLVFASSRDKETARILELALPAFDRVIVTQYLKNPRAVPATELRELASTLSTRPVELAASPAEAWTRLQADSRPEDLICVSGSFFLAAEFRELLFPSA